MEKDSYLKEFRDVLENASAELGAIRTVSDDLKIESLGKRKLPARAEIDRLQAKLSEQLQAAVDSLRSAENIASDLDFLAGFER